MHLAMGKICKLFNYLSDYDASFFSDAVLFFSGRDTSLVDLKGSITFNSFVDKTDYIGNHTYIPIDSVLPLTEMCTVSADPYRVEKFMPRATPRACKTFYDFSQLGDFTFSLPSSFPQGRYAVGIWIFIQNTSELNDGFNVIYDEHVGLHFSYSTSLNVYCFPQEYRNNLNGLKKNGVEGATGLSSKATNFYKYSYSNAGGIWIYSFCSVSLPEGKFYFNNNAIQYMKPYGLYNHSGASIDNKPYFRDFSLPPNANYNLILQGGSWSYNKTKIFLKQMSVFNDYIPQSAMNSYFYYKDLVNFKSSFKSMIFTFNMDEVIADNLSYYVSGVKSTINLIASFVNKSLTSSSYIDHNLCAIQDMTTASVTLLNEFKFSSNQCSLISAICDDTQYFCGYLSGASIIYFWCEDGKLLDNNNICVTGCPNSHSRVPDVFYSYSADDIGYCSFDCNEFNTCESNPIEPSWNISNNWVCNTNYSRLYYGCIKDSSFNSTGRIYFNSYFGFNDTYTNLTAFNLEQYTLEFWMMINPIGQQLLNRTVNNYYFIAPPNLIYMKPSNEIYYKHDNTVEYLLGTLDSNSNRYNWINIMINVTKNTVTNQFDHKVFVNYKFTIPDATFSTTSVQLKGIFFCTLMNSTKNTCTDGTNDYGTYIWGSAYYKDIKIYDHTTHYTAIQQFGKSFDNLLKSLIIYYDFTLSSINQGMNEINNNINLTVHPLTISFWATETDMNRKHNFVEIDYFIDTLGGNKYIQNIKSINLTDTLTDTYLINDCHANCKKCYSNNELNCFECNVGFVLNGRKCIEKNGTFLKSPSKIDNSNIMLNVINLDLKDKLTISFFIKFYGINSKATTSTTYNVILLNNIASLLSIKYNYQNQYFFLNVNNIEAFSATDANFSANGSTITNEILKQKWAFMSVSIYKSYNPTIEPYMLSFSINNVVFTPNAGFNLHTQAPNVDTVIFSFQTVALYSDLRIYEAFIFGTQAFSLSSTLKDSRILYYFPLKSDAAGPINCLESSELDGSSSVTDTDIICVDDYNHFINNECTSNEFILDVYDPIIVNKCKLCNDVCKYTDVNITNQVMGCYNTFSSNCSCYNDRLGQFLVNNNPVPNTDYKYSCQKVKSLNVSYMKELNTKVKISVNNEMTIQFWVYIHSYVKNQFNSLDIIWDGHVRILLKNTQNTNDNNNYLGITCFPFVEISNPDKFITKSTNQLSQGERKWQVITCSVSRRKNFELMNLNQSSETPIINSIFDYQNYINTVKVNDLVPFRIKHGNLNPNYGFSLMRELKLFSAYFWDFYDTSRKNPVGINHVLHYYKLENNLYNVDPVKDTNVVYDLEDIITGNIEEWIVNLDGLIKITGYNYVDEYSELIVCDQGYFYDGSTCQVDISSNCDMSSDGNTDCLICSDSKFLSEDKSCNEVCLDGYGDNYLKMCRDCDPSCKTCNDSNPTNCTSCFSPFYLLNLNNSCVKNCELFNYGFDELNRKCSNCKIYFYLSYI